MVKTLTITATVIAVIPLIFACLMPNWYLGDSQNAIEEVDLDGCKTVIHDVSAYQDSLSRPSSSALDWEHLV